jgi:hypothetical protein
LLDSGWGFPAPHFVEAFGPEDDEVLEWFNSPLLGSVLSAAICDEWHVLMHLLEKEK